MRQLRYVTRSLDGALGARLLAAVSHQELEAWLLSVPSGTTRWNHYRVARRLWQYAIDWLEVVERNPLKKIEVAAERYGRGLGNEKWKMENAKGAEEEWRSVAVLEPGEMGAALDAAENFSEPGRSRLLAWLALGGFAGLRTEEILHARWADVDLGAGEIFVRQPKRVRGWHPRYVKILPACSRVLGGCVRPTDKTAGGASVRSRDAQGRIVWDSPLVLPGGQRSLYLLRRELMDALGWARWPQNCLRHSFGTYHLAMFRDLAALAAEMGHESEGVTRRHYAMPAKRADAEAWWSLGKC
jgi:integrase